MGVFKSRTGISFHVLKGDVRVWHYLERRLERRCRQRHVREGALLCAEETPGPEAPLRDS